MVEIRVFHNAAELAALPADTTAVKGDGVADRDLAAIGGRPDLRVVYLDGCVNLGDAGLQYLAGLPDLRELYLTGHHITDEGLSALTSHAELVELGLDAPVTGEGFVYLSGLPSLAEIHLPACTKLDPANLAFLASVPSLTKLGFYSCRRMTDEWLDRLVGIPGLRVLELRNCPGLSLERIKRLPAEIPGLTVERT